MALTGSATMALFALLVMAASVIASALVTGIWLGETPSAE